MPRERKENEERESGGSRLLEVGPEDWEFTLTAPP